MDLLILKVLYLDLINLFRASIALHVRSPITTLVNSTRGEFTLVYFELTMSITPTIN